MWSSAKTRANKLDLEFNIEPEDIVIPECCPILHIPLKVNKNKPRYDSPTLDRIDNSKGYLKGNIGVISRKANDYKSNMSPAEIKRLYEYIRSG